jgi:hypothetical protein
MRRRALDPKDGTRALEVLPAELLGGSLPGQAQLHSGPSSCCGTVRYRPVLMRPLSADRLFPHATRYLLDEPVAEALGHGRRTIMHAELLVDVLEMGLDGPGA